MNSSDSSSILDYGIPESDWVTESVSHPAKKEQLFTGFSHIGSSFAITCDSSHGSCIDSLVGNEKAISIDISQSELEANILRNQRRQFANNIKPLIADLSFMSPFKLRELDESTHSSVHRVVEESVDIFYDSMDVTAEPTVYPDHFTFTSPSQFIQESRDIFEDSMDSVAIVPCSQTLKKPATVVKRKIDDYFAPAPKVECVRTEKTHFDEWEAALAKMRKHK